MAQTFETGGAIPTAMKPAKRSKRAKKSKNDAMNSLHSASPSRKQGQFKRRWKGGK